MIPNSKAAIELLQDAVFDLDAHKLNCKDRNGDIEAARNYITLAITFIQEGDADGSTKETL